VLTNWLAHPCTRGRNLDDPELTRLRRQIIAEKKFLRLIYQEWYAAMAAALPPMGGRVLELGSGAGFLKDVIPDLITTEVAACDGVDAVLDGLQLPFAGQVLRGIVLINVLHHLSSPRQFFAEAARCVRPGGAILMVEPWVTRWSRLIYDRLHHEPFEPEAAAWEFQSTGPLSSANGALPWIIFQRDRGVFEAEFPEWQVKSIRLMMPFRYLVSGGISLRTLMPGFMFGPWRWLEDRLDRWRGNLAMFALIELSRVGNAKSLR
jgi:SAM-dependent methyltransferase